MSNNLARKTNNMEEDVQEEVGYLHSIKKELTSIGKCLDIQDSACKIAILYDNGLKVSISKLKEDLFYITYNYKTKRFASLEPTLNSVIDDITREYQLI